MMTPVAINGLSSNVINFLLTGISVLSLRFSLRSKLPKSRRCQMTFRQKQPVVAGMLYQMVADFHQPLLQAGQRLRGDLRQ